MKLLKIFTVLVVLTGVGLIAVVTAPSIYGQRDDRPERRSRELSAATDTQMCGTIAFVTFMETRPF